MRRSELCGCVLPPRSRSQIFGDDFHVANKYPYHSYLCHVTSHTVNISIFVCPSNPFPVIEPYLLAMTSFGGKRERRRTEKIEPSFWRESWISTIVRAMPNYDLRPLYPIELCWIRIERVHNMSQHLRACDLNLNTERSISINSSSDS